MATVSIKVQVDIEKSEDNDSICSTRCEFIDDDRGWCNLFVEGLDNPGSNLFKSVRCAACLEATK